MVFNIGQIVELNETRCCRTAASILTGDRGTVVRREATIVVVLWHKLGIEGFHYDRELRVYVNPADAPGRSQGAFATMQALRVVLQEEEPHAMEEVLRELERARMKAEDFAQGNAVMARYHDHAEVTWRQWDANQEAVLETLAEIARASDGGTAQEQVDALARIRHALAYE